ncbi:MAG: 16S rRNA (cytosine(967)-C(5))-methyltransferase RsmB [Syntrophobacteraceae bacterium]|nr:16S rRNA (cytosine(967)-C(5))-methyltransferase RsmB [Syntrophobacteraceae bacterium]
MVTSRILAYHILLHLEQKAPHPDRLIRTTLERHSRLDERDRALLTELVYGVLRWRGRLDWHIDQLSRTRADKIAPQVRVLLRLALYQILFLDRIPDHAAVNDAVEVAKSSQPPHVIRFINALLREAARRGANPESAAPDLEAAAATAHIAPPPAGARWNWPDPRKDPAACMAVMTSHPVWLTSRMIAEIGLEEAGLFFEASNRIAPAVFRINTLRTSREEAIASLLQEGIDATPSARLEHAIRVTAPRRDMTGTNAFRQGLIQSQDEASQIVSLLLFPEPGERVLDLCGGLGVKSSHIAMLMKNEGEVLTVDTSAWKLDEARKNGQRQAITIIRTLAEDVLSLQPQSTGLFDRVLLDAPCTGWGSVRRKPDIKWRRHIKDSYRLSLIQKELLIHAAAFVKPGGVLVYATCTVFREENESVAQHLESNTDLALEPALEHLPPLCREMTSGPYYRSWPHKHDQDGFFSARWRRR